MQKEWAETKLSANKTSIILKEEENKIGIFNNIKEPIFSMKVIMWKNK